MSRAKTRKKTSNNQTYLWIGLALAAVIIIAAVFMLTRPQAGGDTTAALPKEITVAEAAQLRDQGAFILDVREQDEWNDYHIPGATLIPLGELSSRLNEVPQDQTVVVVCRSGNRSASGRDILLNAGFTQVTSMAGGVSSWRSQGLETVSGQ
ncbi:MAG TPA: rhodanese-like domain-containing protein [Bellilinea sp.]|nr:rhodanese-like domain-containing protein [Bellilinea sp.]